MLRSLIFLLLICLLSSCAPFSKELMRQVDETLTFEQIKKDPLSYIGKKVLFGGVIIETKNKPEETIIIIRQTELDFEKRPKNLDKSSGRFIAKCQGFLDPAVYHSGREVSVGGEIIGKEVLPLGEITYEYPVILAKEIILWEKRPQYIRVYPWHCCPYYYHPYHPWWPFCPWL